MPYETDKKLNKGDKMKVYLDNAATTPVLQEVIKSMRPFFSRDFGNPSSIHSLGKKARTAVENARNVIARSINALPEEIVFTSGGTESDNLAIKGIADAFPDKKHIITSVIEHPAVFETCKSLENKGYNVDYIRVNKEGIVDVDDIKNKITGNTLIVSIMHVNNEIGSMQPIEDIARICREKNVVFHTDAVQSFGKEKIDVKKMNIGMLSMSAHKINGPKGVGFLFVNRNIKINPILTGGKHENNLRSGTENVAGIAGMAKAVESACNNLDRNKARIKRLRDRLMRGISEIENTRINGSIEKGIYNTLNVSFAGVEGESLVLLLDKKGIAASTGSACSSKSLKASRILKAIGLSDLEAHSSLRLTLGNDSDEKQIDYTIKIIKDSVKRLRRITGEIAGEYSINK